ncbi:sigma-54-dependent transcriptional regulator [Neobacillus sp. LXY-4]|uniref:sigma-54-dependent transcriptional regulator n=1 Tax=Neobacillus sp. LXY-4 TaxID=3379826 RepID=UPI003EDF8B95
MIHLLIVDDEKEVGNFLSHLFSAKGYKVTVANSGEEFLRLNLTKQIFQAALIDLKLPDTDGLSLLAILKKQQPGCKAVAMTGYSTIHTAVEAMKLGASDYIEKPFDDIDVLEKQIEHLIGNTTNTSDQNIHEIAERMGFIIGKNDHMNRLIQTAYKVAGKNINVLIEGETGTGKEVLARFIHEASLRCEEPFVGVNCGAISETLLESELFGHEKGAFTGAIQQRKGLFEIASKGTLFLDEIAEASHSIQVKLLRILETREYMRVGSEKMIQTNTRLVAASNENLFEAVEKKKFREDLLYRLNVVHLKIPPLRERKEDIPLLVDHVIQRQGGEPITFTEEALEALQAYSWPGNIRELANFVMRVMTLSDCRNGWITASDLPLFNQGNPAVTVTLPEKKDHTDLERYIKEWSNNLLTVFEQKEEINLENILGQMKDLESQVGKAFIYKTLKDTLGNRKEAAKRLQITMRKLRYLLNEKKIEA